MLEAFIHWFSQSLNKIVMERKLSERIRELTNGGVGDVVIDPSANDDGTISFYHHSLGTEHTLPLKAFISVSDDDWPVIVSDLRSGKI